MGCLDNVIKLSRTECECFLDYSPLPDFSEGQSEVYLDELPGLTLTSLKGAENCREGGLWDMMSKARNNATLQFKADILAALNEKVTPRRPVYAGLLGQSSFTGTLNISHSKAGLKTTFANIVGGYMTVKRIGLAVNQSTNVTVQVYDNDEYSTTPIAQYTIATTANAATFATISGGLKLPMWSRNGVTLKYYFVYSLGGGLQPKDCKTDCGCGGASNQVTWKQWTTVGGISGNSTDYDNFSNANNRELNGVLLDVQFSCETARFICSEEYPLDFENDGRAMQMAYAIRFKAGELLVQNILDSEEINRFTMLDREALYGKRAHYRKSYEDLIIYLNDTLELTNNDCMICKNSNTFAKGKILI